MCIRDRHPALGLELDGRADHRIGKACDGPQRPGPGLCGQLLVPAQRGKMCIRDSPELVQLFLFAGGKGRNVRQGGEKAFVVGQCRRDPGLLQHDLAEPHMVGAGVGAEGQDAVVFVEPVQECGRNVFHFFCAPYQKTGRRKVQQPGKSMRAYQKPYAVRGKEMCIRDSFEGAGKPARV